MNETDTPIAPDTALTATQAAANERLALTKLKQAVAVLAGIAVAHGQVTEEQQAQIAELLS